MPAVLAVRWVACWAAVVVPSRAHTDLLGVTLVGELSLVRSGLQSVQDTLRQSRQHAALARSLQDEVRMLSRKIDELQAGILEVRMVPLGQVFEKLSRVIRKLSREAGKEIRFVVSGAETELDKLIVEELSDPLMHVIRNAIDHGIEVTAVRRAASGRPSSSSSSALSSRSSPWISSSGTPVLRESSW